MNKSLLARVKVLEVSGTIKDMPEIFISVDGALTEPERQAELDKCIAEDRLYLNVNIIQA